MLRKKKLPDVAAGVLALVLGVVSILEAVRLYPMRNSVMAGDHSMPALLGVAMVILAVLQLFVVKSDDVNAVYPDKQTMRVLVGTVIIMFGYWILMKYAGYIVATLLASFLLFRHIGSFSWLKSAVIASVTTAAIYLVFVYWLNMVLPQGFLF